MSSTLENTGPIYEVFVTIDQSGNVTGFYPVDVFPYNADGSRHAGIPSGAFGISIDTYSDWRLNQSTRRWENNTLTTVTYTPPVTIPQVILRRQFFQELAVDKIITNAEALAAVQSGAVPAAVASVLSKLPSDQQFAATMVISGDPTFSRNHPVTLAIGAAYGWSSSQIDAFWTAASAL